jgi:hypothetical protein
MSNVYDALVKAAKRPHAITPLSLSFQSVSREWKVLLLVFGILFIVILSHLMARALRMQMHENAALMTTNLSDAAAGYLASKNVLQLQTTVAKYARLSKVAYAFIGDREGKVIAHSLTTLSPELLAELTADQPQKVARRELIFQGKPVYESREPILDGQLGREVYHALFMFVWPITLGLLAIAMIVVLLIRQLIQTVRPLIESRLGSAQATSTRPLE